MADISNKKRYIYFFIITGSIILLDQVTKSIIHNKMRLYETIIVIDNFFNLTYVRNPGGAFSIFAETSERFRFIFFISASIIALILLVIFFIKTEADDKLTSASLSLIFGGAVGNLIDRIISGEVIDFLDFYLKGYHWPSFNIADSSITIGVSLLMLNIMLKRNDTKEIP
ncbi:MAG: signal peptidase II [Nitrospirota bacterium]